MTGKSHKKWLGWLTRAASSVIALAVLIGSVVWLSGSFEEKIAPATSASAGQQRFTGDPNQIDRVHEVTKDYIEEAIGTLKAASRSIISAKVMATITAINVAAGDQVKEGEVLVQLDDQELAAQLRQAEHQLDAATATRLEAEQDFARAAQLVGSKVITQAEYDTAVRQVDVGKANASRAQQAVTVAQVLLSYTTIRAPKAGRIVDRLAEPGDTARPGEPLLVLYDAASLRLEAPVPEQLAVTLKVGQKLNVHVDALNRDIEATIDEIVPQADAPSRSLLVKASLPRTDGLYEGMFGRLAIPAGSRRHLCLAESAIERVGQLEFVDVVRSDGTLERRYIKTGQLGMPGRIEVLSGLAMGEEVVLHGPAPDWASPAPGQLPPAKSSGRGSRPPDTEPGLVPVQDAPVQGAGRHD
jgi:RND family efflux transporter MFP subunit